MNCRSDVGPIWRGISYGIAASFLLALPSQAATVLPLLLQRIVNASDVPALAVNERLYVLGFRLMLTGYCEGKANLSGLPKQPDSQESKFISEGVQDGGQFLKESPCGAGFTIAVMHKLETVK